MLIPGLVILFLSFSICLTNQAATPYGLPPDALIIEEHSLAGKGYPHRALLLWMIKPEKRPNEYEATDPYTCPDETRGSYYTGATRVSLIDRATGQIINTVEVKQEYEEGEDSFDIPYAIREGYYYKVEGEPKEGEEAKPQIMWLKDYNGDGSALEFALFDAPACMGLQTTLIGYSTSKDKVIQYLIKLEVDDEGKADREESHWADYLFSKKPLRPGYWRYEIDYRGRGGSLCKYEISYNKREEQFEGRLVYQHRKGL